ncbi:uncharacterized protein C2orf50 [Aplysia californica]|uniref:Uncharacterized protein C2orf50 n=1 Tax=Aplysia californica TaxID=6500 RepID=A0ABM1VXI2_APLCA|nr:uncharacterized protein C2orf50 [Aplysia californica]XP_005104075.1 uncharacterized protein C2orf50 [Aplysia californica]XP_005104076.1 uncharacterized protein C2orf50 [Aplysia californica]XP_035827125.1 uncharacterized protein C2orf50 [Aplysia californica]
MSSGVVASYMLATRKSQYHDSCVPKPVNPPPEPAAPGKPAKDGDYNKCDAVTQDVIWKQSVHTERRCLKNWGDSWGFITDYDAKGNIKEKEELPEKSVMFSDDIPNTNSGNYGHRLDTEPAKAMQSLEFKFFSEGRRRKLPSDMICY